MRIVSSSLVLLLAASLTAADDPVPEACKLLTDGDNPLLASVSHLSGLTPAQLAKLQIDSLLAPIDAALPWLSKCVANVDLTQVVADLTASPAVGQCLKTLEAEAAKAPQDDGFSDAYFHEVMCPTLKDTVVPCLNDVLVPELTKSLERAGSCCQDLGATVTAGLGAEIPQVVDTLSKLMVNTLCSVKSPTGDASTGETCGYSLVANLFGHGDDEATTLLNIAAAVQIPENSACDAANGREFHTATGGVATFAGESDEQPFGVCYTAVQNLVEYVKGFPFWSSAFVHKAGDEALQPLSDLFSADTCVRGDALLQWALADDSYLLKLAVVADNLQSLFKMSPAESTESEPNSGTENEKKPETETEVEPTTEDDTETKTEDDTETKTETDTETDSEPKTETETNVETDPAAETAASSETETESKNETDHGTEAGVSGETETKPKNETETDPGEEAGVSDETETEPKTETDPTTEAEPNTETETETTDETESETETEDKDTTESETEGEGKGESESEPEGTSETEPEPATEPNAETATDETTNTEDVTETETDTKTVEEAETEAEEKADAEEAAMDIIGDDDTTTGETGGDDYYDGSDIHIEVVDTAVPDIPDVPTLLDREDPVVAPEIATENAAAAALREALQEFVQPLALVCVHFPSATTCSFPDQQLEFAFGDVGHVPAGDQQ